MTTAQPTPSSVSGSPAAPGPRRSWRGRGWVAVPAVLGMLAALLSGCTGSADAGGSHAAGGSSGKTVTFGVSATAPGGNMLQLGIAQAQKYFAAEGITVRAVFLGSSGSVVQAIASDKVQIGLSTPDVLIEAREHGQDVKMFYNWTTANVAKFAVLPDGGVRTLADLKGATVGVQSLSSGPAQLARAALTNAGLKPDSDVKFVAVGSGAPALDALQRGRVQALMAYDTLFAAMTSGTDQKLRFIAPQGTEDLFGSSMVASSSWLKENPDQAAGFGRAWAKASVFAQTNPQAGIQMMFQLYPSSKVGSSPAAAAASALMQFQTRQASLDAGPSVGKWGQYSPQAVEHWVQYARQFGLIKKAVNPADVYTNSYVSKFNAFDAAKVKASAHKVNS